MKHKYPRTSHLIWSPGATDDDKVLESVDQFIGKEVVCSAKMDGENSSLYRNAYHARSLDSRHHPSRDWLKAFHGTFAHEIPESWRFCGENMYAVHTIKYTELPSYFLLFAIYNDSNFCLSWDDTLEWAGVLGITTVPELYRGIWDEEKIKACYTGGPYYGGIQEGYVVRVTSGFHYDDFTKSVAKFVRANHVDKEADHWMHQEVVPNLLAQ